ncbi:MAG: hypothetical protein GKR91_04980 [Pseudomonadales bacterium]|nr:hypothetical protein [Pseudomonadales bacterium]
MLVKSAMMVVLVYAVLSLLLCIGIAASPSLIVLLADVFQSETGKYISSSIDLIMGVMFFVAAPAAKFKLFFRIFSAVLFLAGIFYYLLPTDNWAAYIDFWLIDNPLLLRVFGGGFGILFCGFTIYAAVPRNGELDEAST